MKIQFSQENTPETNQVYEKLLDVSVNAYTNKSNEELSLLSKDQQKIIFEILNGVDLSTIDLRKPFVQKIQADPKITQVVHFAISSRKKGDNNYLALDQELIRSSIDGLQHIELGLTNLEDKTTLLRDWWTRYSVLFDKKTLELLSTDDLYQLAALLYNGVGLNLPKHQTILQNLPEHGKKYYQALQLKLNLSEFWKEICKIHPSPSEERFIALSHYISSKETPFSKIQDLLSSDDLPKLLPYLRFGNFNSVNDDVITSTLTNATRLQYIEIRSPTITILPELPACKKLDCSSCKALNTLPSLPACTEVSFFGCAALTALPPLPACTEASFFGCTALTTLPSLPACKKLNCSGCRALTALPQLPACIEASFFGCSALNTLPELPACKKLNCSGCRALTALPQLPACIELVCSSCTALIDLPPLPLCIEASFFECTALTALPLLPACVELNCSNCTALTALPLLPACKKLNCLDCIGLSALPELPVCLKLDCSYCSALTTLPLLSACIELNCSDCEALTALPLLPACKKLKCPDCIALSALPELPVCLKLDCSCCTALTTLPMLSACIEFNCSDCEALTALPLLPACKKLKCPDCIALSALPELPVCLKLDCSCCTALTTLPLLPACIELNCSDCTSLRQLPEALPACVFFNCENCPSLTNAIPELSWNTQVYIGDSDHLQFTKLEVDLEELSSNPRKVLLDLGGHLLQNKPFPNIYYRLKKELSEVVDIGGVRRDFISRLMESLFAENRMNGKLVMSHDKFPRLNDKQDIDCYRTLGRVFSLCCPQNSYFKIGALFSAEVYKKIAFLADPLFGALDIASDENIVSMYLYYRNFPGFLKLIDASDSTVQQIDESILQNACIFLGIDEEKRPSYFEEIENRKLLKKEVIVGAQLDPQFQAIRLIAQEIKRQIGADAWDRLHQEGPEKLQERIEGVLSKNALLNKLQWEETPSSASIDQGLKDKTKGYLKNWIERAALEDLSKFVRAVSSNNTLGPNTLKIQLFNRGPQFVPVARTCFFTLELSADYPTQETFDNKINVLLTEGMAGSGFQIA